MIAIICAIGIIDATGCRIHVTEAEGYTSVSGELSVPVSGHYNLMLTSLDKEKKVNFAIMQFPDKGKAEFVFQHIANAKKNGKECVDIRDFEKEKPVPIS